MAWKAAVLVWNGPVLQEKISLVLGFGKLAMEKSIILPETFPVQMPKEDWVSTDIGTLA
jgi:hypothetical protein